MSSGLQITIIVAIMLVVPAFFLLSWLVSRYHKKSARKRSDHRPEQTASRQSESDKPPGRA